MEKKRYSDRVRYIKISLAPYFSGEEPTFKQFTEFNTTFLQGAILCLFVIYGGNRKSKLWSYWKKRPSLLLSL